MEQHIGHHSAQLTLVKTQLSEIVITWINMIYCVVLLNWEFRLFYMKSLLNKPIQWSNEIFDLIKILS